MTNELRKLGFMSRRDHDAKQAELQTIREVHIGTWRRLGSVLTQLGVAPKVAARLSHSRYSTESVSFTSEEILSIIEDLTEMVSGAVEVLNEIDLDPGAVYDARHDDEQSRLYPEGL